MADNDDDYEDNTVNVVSGISSSKMGRKALRVSATELIPELMIRRALSPAQARKLRRDSTTAVVILAPDPAWVAPLAKAAKRLGDWMFVHEASTPPRKQSHPDTTSQQAVYAMAQGGRTLGVSHNLDYLPAAMTATADILLKIEAPDDAMLIEAIKACTGRTPLKVPEGISMDLEYADICGAIRNGSSAKACVDRLMIARKRKSRDIAGLPAVPFVEELHGYGLAMDWATALIADLEAWRGGTLNFAAIDRTVVLASAPGLGKTTFARSLAKSAKLPIFATSVSSWFANSPGYLDSIIKQIDQVFDEAAAVAPAIVFLDEIESIPNRATLDHRSDWWTPVVGHMLLKLDSAASADTSKLIIIGATNHPEKLDAALVRPGRLSRIIRIGNPDAEALTGIMRQHLGADLSNADLKTVSTLAVGNSGAQVADWVKAARRVARHAARPMELEDLISQIIPPETRPADLVRRIAVHEAAHAVVSRVLEANSVESVSIVSRDPSEGGYTSTTWGTKGLLVRSEIEAAVTVCLAGRCGEQVLLGAVSNGAGGAPNSDLARATSLLAAIHASLGLGEQLLHRSPPQTVVDLLNADYGLSALVESELQRLYAKAISIIELNVQMVDAVAEALIKHRHLTRGQFASICADYERVDISRIAGEQNG